MPAQWLKGPSGTEFYVNTYPADEPIACMVFCHGFIEHIGRYTEIFPLYAQKGISVLAYDQRGFGKTACDKEHNNGGTKYAVTSSTDQRKDLEHFYNAIDDVFPTSAHLPRFIMGHSMGGAIALGFVTRGKFAGTPNPKTFKKPLLAGVIATSPLLHQAKPAPKIARILGGMASVISPNFHISTEVKAEDLSHDDAINKAYLDDPLVIMKGTLKGVSDMLNLGEELVKEDFRGMKLNVPILVIHGSEDKVSSCSASAEFVRKLPDGYDRTFSYYEGGFHELHNEPSGGREKLVNEVIEWILKRAHLPEEAVTEDSTVSPARL